jgi:hypothetical protein
MVRLQLRSPLDHNTLLFKNCLASNNLVQTNIFDGFLHVSPEALLDAIEPPPKSTKTIQWGRDYNSKLGRSDVNILSFTLSQIQAYVPFLALLALRVCVVKAVRKVLRSMICEANYVYNAIYNESTTHSEHNHECLFCEVFGKKR